MLTFHFAGLPDPVEPTSLAPPTKTFGAPPQSRSSSPAMTYI
jgi:hypothetical protein